MMRLSRSRLSLALAAAAMLSLVLTSTVLGAHPVYRSGAGSIAQTCGADLDNVLFHCDTVSGPSNDDINFIAHTSTNRVITYNNHIFNKIKKMLAKPTYATCASAV